MRQLPRHLKTPSWLADDAAPHCAAPPTWSSQFLHFPPIFGAGFGPTTPHLLLGSPWTTAKDSTVSTLLEPTYFSSYLRTSLWWNSFCKFLVMSRRAGFRHMNSFLPTLTLLSTEISTTIPTTERVNGTSLCNPLPLLQRLSLLWFLKFSLLVILHQIIIYVAYVYCREYREDKKYNSMRVCLSADCDRAGVSNSRWPVS